ncbi:MAG: phospholipid/cholesterol/gamma-HCH transport system substrate-binding protein [Verrucomicrobiota bacterium]|jgi:ABC-type transporter Mla subunit MlaD
MPVQDLTPQLRTRLSRLEKWVGIFVTLATLLVLVGLVFYVHQMARRKGWYVVKLPYYTFVDSAAGLKVGQPVKMMGFEVGEITEIEAQQPGDYYDVYVAFRITVRHVGYMWDDSKARVVAGDFLGNRYIEVTKGTNGVPSYLFNPLIEVDIAAAQKYVGSTNFFFAQEVLDASKTNFVTMPGKPVTAAALRQVEESGVRMLQFMDKATTTKWPTALWVPKSGRYETFHRGASKGYFLPPDEQPALTERLEQVANTIRTALPNVLDLTNYVQKALTQAADAAGRADELLAGARPLITNLAAMTAQLTNGAGTLGDWLLPTNLNAQLSTTLTNANATVISANLMLTNTDAHLAEVATTLNRALEGLAGITSNLHHQVDMNTNILASLSKLVVDSDDLIQGLKHHWLLRSAFKEKKTNAPPSGTIRRTTSPKDSSR